MHSWATAGLPSMRTANQNGLGALPGSGQILQWSDTDMTSVEHILAEAEVSSPNLPTSPLEQKSKPDPVFAADSSAVSTLYE